MSLAEKEDQKTLDGFTFEPWPKTARLLRGVVITEKLDGTNAAVIVKQEANGGFRVAAQSRNRLITPGRDNFGFAGWVDENADELARFLGPGRHFGEWWGRGIQRGYGMETRNFSLFNTARFGMADSVVIGGVEVDSVPVLHSGPFDEADIRECLRRLRVYGSYAAPGFMNPEGICVYHTALRTVLKVTLDNNDAGKWEGV
ncbi:RNA ligase family protein [Streptomyces sp. SM12]|uniref:RNA ligase family protein n=1 Tax=Streptomyces sp. SM12 TaxID=1071602 RepID=UPI000CD49E4F|nr:RNA ligase family protein [Streptomyces sp. SM12]